MTRSSLPRLLYSLFHYLLMPLIALRLLVRGARNTAYLERLQERAGFGPAFPGGGAVVWIHAVSVGEVQAALPLVRALRERWPGMRLLVTTTTPTGRERVAQALGDGVQHRYVPYDLPGCVRRFLARCRPSLAIMMETELWPNILYQCRCRSIPVVLANVRLSARSAAGYARFPGLVRGMLADVSAVACQTREDAQRLIALGAPPPRVVVTGSVKFDVRVPASIAEEGQVLRRCFGVERGVWIAASTHEGEDEQVLDAFARLLAEHVNALLVLVPRHPERFGKAAALARRRGYSTVLRSQAPASCAGVDVFVGDTMGELTTFYAAADVAFVGGSLVRNGGHNPLEPAALGVPVITGPHTFNFAEITRRLCEEGAARQVSSARELGQAVAEFLGDANLRHNTGEQGRRFVEQNRGALERLMNVLEPFLPSSGAAVLHNEFAA